MPMKPAAFAKLQAAWAAKLAATGFQDLEGTDRDAPLSNRGKLHDGTGKTSTSTAKVDDGPAHEDGDYATFAHRVEHGAVYTEWAQDVLQRLNGCSAEARQRRRIWEAHANGESLKGIARTQGINFHVARGVVRSIEEKFKRCQETKAPKNELSRSVRQVPTTTLVKLAASMLLAMRNTA